VAVQRFTGETPVSHGKLGHYRLVNNLYTVWIEPVN